MLRRITIIALHHAKGPNLAVRISLSSPSTSLIFIFRISIHSADLHRKQGNILIFLIDDQRCAGPIWVQSADFGKRLKLLRRTTETKISLAMTALIHYIPTLE
jgi:hypothetical protein